MILLIGGEKGGAGKSTLACNMAVYLSIQKKDVLLVDADPQKSSSIWASRRNDLDSVPKIQCVEKTGNIADVIKDFKKRYAFVIVDTGGRDSKELRSGLIVANKFYTPIKPSQIDIDTLAKMNELVEYASSINTDLVSYSIITQAPTNPNMNDKDETSKILSLIPSIHTSNVVIKYRSSYWRSMGQGLSVLEYSDDTKSMTEITNLGYEIFNI